MEAKRPSPGVATAALDSARRSEDALQWARAALHYDATNEEARWCEGTKRMRRTDAALHARLAAVGHKL